MAKQGPADQGERKETKKKAGIGGLQGDVVQMCRDGIRKDNF